MKQIATFIFISIFTFLQAGINECKSDVYFANGINTSKKKAEKSIKQIEEKFKMHSSEAYQTIADWKVSYNHTFGIGIDLYESMIQKIYEGDYGVNIKAVVWNILDLFNYSVKGLIKKIAQKAAKEETKEYARELAKKMAKEAFIKLGQGSLGKEVTEQQLEEMFVYLLDQIIDETVGSIFDMTEEEIIAQEKQDVEKQVNAYSKSVESGHGVIIIAHSQGNFFTNRAFFTFSDPTQIKNLTWVQQYFYVMGVATPANNVIGEKTPYLTFDNDMIRLVPDSLDDFVENPKRYFFVSSTGEKIEIHYSIKAHAFLESYMATDLTRQQILKFIDNAVLTHKNAPSQYIPKSADLCMVGTIRPMEHRFQAMPDLKDVYFLEMGKIHGEGNSYVMSQCRDVNDSNHTAHDGKVTVGLTWRYPYIDMDLDFQAEQAVKDLSDLKDTAFEHYYVEDDLSVGTYGVFANSKGEIDETCVNSRSPETLIFNVITPDGGEMFALDIKDPSGLNIGHVLDIVVKDGNYSTVSKNSGCIDCNHTLVKLGKSRRQFDETKHIYGIVPMLTQALLGPLGGATIEVRDAFGSAAEPLASGSTTYGGSSITTGLISMPSDFMTSIDATQLYLLSIHGGQDIDVDDDMAIDQTPTENNGTLRALLFGSRIEEGGYKVNILTEIAYQVTKHMLEANVSTAEIIAHLDDVASRLLKNVTNTNAPSDYEAVLGWLPYDGKSRLRADYDRRILPIVEKVHLGQDIYADAYALVYANLDFEQSGWEGTATDGNFTFTINASVEMSMIESVEIILTDETGNIIKGQVVLNDRTLSFIPSEALTEGKNYTLTFTVGVRGDKGQLLYTQFTELVTIPDITPPQIDMPDKVHVNENIQTVVYINAMDTSLPLTYVISGGVDANLFSIDTMGHLIFNNAPNFEKPDDSNKDNTYEVQVRITDSVGNAVDVNITIVVDDVYEAPVLGQSIMVVDEDIPVGSQIGHVTLISEGDGNITRYELDYWGYLDFGIDKNGTIITRNPFDFEKENNYRFQARAVNSVGQTSAWAEVIVNVKDVEEPLPELHPFTGSMDEHAPAGKEVGQMYVYPGLGTGLSVALEGDGSKDFVIDTNGTISVSPTADLNRMLHSEYHLEAIGTNSLGASQSVEVVIFVNKWTRQYGTSASDSTTAIVVDTQNNIYTAGWTYGAIDGNASEGKRSVLLSKFDPAGKQLWIKQYKNEFETSVSDMAIGSDGTIYLVGSQYSKPYSCCNKINYRTAGWIMAVSNDGDELWTHLYNSGDDYWDSVERVVADKVENLYILGETGGSIDGGVNYGHTDIFVAKLTNENDTIWLHQIGTRYSDFANGIALDDDGKLFVLEDEMLVKYDSNGKLIWMHSYPCDTSTSYDCNYYKDFTFDGAGNLFLVGVNDVYWETEYRGYYDLNVTLAKVDMNGTMLWSRHYGTLENDTASRIIYDPLGVLYIVGNTSGDLNGNFNKTPYLESSEKSDLFLMKMDLNGTEISTKQYGTIDNDSVLDMVIDLDGNVLLGGLVYEALDGNPPLGVADAFLMKIGD
ncbi:SBBP repeat-containing protein [Sulfurimonas diazotrophicus]|uniref:SBBP repeat-containing protein n=1 Tax=Sulfurimonas diazotrophicus TaxID=3131939 RepID=A0ABZ3H665_9BACT